MQTSLVGRQPIFGLKEEIFAYELLFRDSKQNSAKIEDSRFATAKVLTNTLNSFGLDKIVSDKKAFVNVDKEFLHDDVVESIPPERFVLEILEGVKVDGKLVNRVLYLKDKGYSFAIDDLNMEEENLKNFEPLFPYVDIAKIDLISTRSLDKIERKLEFFSRFQMNLLAEKVENVKVFDQCRSLGFELFQGYFFAKPNILETRRLDPTHNSVLQLIHKINSGNDIKELESEFSHNPSLTLGLLKYINSSQIGTKKEISSIPQAINLLGRTPLVQWLTLSLYSTIKENIHKDSLLDSALLRAELMGAMATRYKLTGDTPNKAYLIGLVSNLGPLLQVPMEAIFEDIAFDKEIADAVLRREGLLGKLLKIVIVFERGDFTKIRDILKKIQMSEAELTQILSRCYTAVVDKGF